MCHRYVIDVFVMYKKYITNIYNKNVWITKRKFLSEGGNVLQFVMALLLSAAQNAAYR